MRLRGPKVRLARQLGIALTPKAARIMDDRPHPPGQHGASMRRKTSEYKKQLMEKQRLRAQYNVSERQLQNAFTQATRLGGDTGEKLLQRLELRLDAVVLRAGFSRTIFAARQAVTHGHFTVNGRRTNVPSRILKPGDIVALKPSSREKVAYTQWLADARPPAYLDVDRDKRSTRVSEVPSRDQIPVQCETSLVVEYYSR
jgi:small subunit ribosomal protein S4